MADPKRVEGGPVLSAKDERALDKANDQVGREDGIPPPVNLIQADKLQGFLDRYEAGKLPGASAHWIATLKARLAGLRKE